MTKMATVLLIHQELVHLQNGMRLMVRMLGHKTLLNGLIAMVMDLVTTPQKEQLIQTNSLPMKQQQMILTVIGILIIGHLLIMVLIAKASS